MTTSWLQLVCLFGILVGMAISNTSMVCGFGFVLLYEMLKEIKNDCKRKNY